MRRNAMGRRALVALPGAKLRSVLLAGRAQPGLGVAAKFRNVASRRGAGPKQEAAPLEAQIFPELLFQATQANRRVETPGSEIVGIDDQMNGLHSESLS